MHFRIVTHDLIPTQIFLCFIKTLNLHLQRVNMQISYLNLHSVSQLINRKYLLQIYSSAIQTKYFWLFLFENVPMSSHCHAEKLCTELAPRQSLKKLYIVKYYYSIY